MKSISEFLSVFYPDEHEPVCLRTFDAKKVPDHLRGYADKFEVSRDQLQHDRVLQQKLKQINQTQGIYFVVNAGGQHDKNIKRINAVFCEMDDRETIIEQHDCYDMAPWTPSIQIVTKKSVHAYYLLEESLPVDQFMDFQKGLIGYFKSDSAIKNLSRVMRLPYFNHVSYDDGYIYHPITFHSWRPDFRYTLAELREAFPVVHQPKKPTQTFEAMYSLDTWKGVYTELRRRMSEQPTYTIDCHEWASCNGICHNGEGSTGLRVNLISGIVSCWSECGLETILNAFGLRMPQEKKGNFQYIQAPEQKSELHKWLQEKKNGKSVG